MDQTIPSPFKETSQVNTQVQEPQVKQESKDLTDEQISDLSDEVMHPELGGREVKFLNQTFTMVPLPISFSKRISKLIRPVMQKVASVAKLAEKDPEAAVEDNPLDDQAVGAMVQAVGIMLQFYRLDHLVPLQKVEDEVTVTSLYDFLMAQMELNGKNDFLLQPLRMLLSIVRASSMAETQIAETN